MSATKATVFALALVFTASAAQALTISNRDARSYKLQITEGTESNSVEIKPQEELRDLCKQACQIVIEGDPEAYELEVADVVQVEEGQLYVADAEGR